MRKGSEKNGLETRAEKSSFELSAVIHDLNNVMQSLSVHVELLRRHVSDNGIDHISALKGGLKQIHELINSLSENSIIPPKRVDLGLLLNKTLNILSPSIPLNITINKKGVEEGHFIRASEVELSQILINLICNARDALSSRIDGEMTISLIPTELFLCKELQDKNSLESRNDRTGEDQNDDENNEDLKFNRSIILSVRDNGEGISEENKRKIFDPFFSTKGFSGNGIGLTIVRSIVETLGGEISVFSTEGSGTRFDIYLPLDLACEQPSRGTILKDEQKIEKPEAIIYSSQPTVLVVDDEDSVRMVISKGLELFGFNVFSASSGAEALTILQEHKIEAVVLDMIMPCMTGDEVFFKMRQTHKELPVIIASGYSNDKSLRRVLAETGTAYIQKPFGIDELANTIRLSLMPQKNLAVA